ncbi:MAG: FGGY-family carbohydrate kinase [Planctomycetota bacterium]|jgi:sugar (pentulose or hexulose) kinase
MIQHIAVVDIGKTNKKVAIYNRQLEMVDVVKIGIDEIHRDGLHFEDIERMTAWVKEQVKAMAAKYEIAAISVTTHGATFTCLDENGEVCVPMVAYTTETAPEVSDAFFEKFGDRETLQQETATAEIGSLINPGKLIHFLQNTYPEEFARVKHILNFPQYWGHLFTGKFGAEPTYVGCHSYLYDPAKKTYSRVAKELGILDKLPPKIGKSWDVLGTVSPAMQEELGLSGNCIVTMGIHDSNASLLPYLVQQHSDFALNSTGTWCVAMHPAKEVRFDPEELGKTVFYNQDAFFNPVKTSIFLGGMEFDAYLKIFQNLSGEEKFPGDLREVTARVVAEKKLFILPSVARGVGIFPSSKPCAIENGKRFPLEGIEDGSSVPEFFSDFDTAAAVLNLALVLQTQIALDYADFAGKGALYVEGGSRKDVNYMGLLAALFPEATVASTHLEEATSYGAAILAEAALQKADPMVTKDLFTIEINPVDPIPAPGVEAYFEAYLGLL